MANTIPPHEPSAERAILGLVLIDNSTWPTVRAGLKTTDFYYDKHRHMFDAMTTLAQEGSGIDAITLHEELRRKQWLEASGGAGAIAYAIEHASINCHLADYIKIVKEHGQRRELIQLCTRAIHEAYAAEHRLSWTLSWLTTGLTGASL